MAKLTPRQKQVADLVADGKGPGAISQELGIAKVTVDAHLTAIRRRKNLHSLLEISAYIWRQRKTYINDVDHAP